MSDKDNLTNKIWSLIGKLALAVGLIWALIQIYDHLSKNEYDVQVYGAYQHFSLPDTIASEFAALRVSMHDSLITFIENYYYTNDSTFNQFNQIFQLRKGGLSLELLTDFVPKQIEPFNDLVSWRSIWKFRIKNNGDKELTNLNLEIPFEGIYQINRSGQKPNTGQVIGSLALGSLRPSNEIEVLIWTVRDASRSYESDIRITYTNGVVGVEFSRKVRGLLAWLDHLSLLWILLWAMLKSILVGLVLILLVFLAVKYIKKYRHQKLNQET